jgi:hypothetical protein
MAHLLPIVIYHEIHSFLKHHDYRQLTNCSSSVFRSIKYETVYYNFSLNAKELTQEIEIGCSKYNQFVNNVNHKSRQISVSFVNFTHQALTVEITNCFSLSNLHRLYVYNFTIPETYNIDFMGTISHIKLSYIIGLRKLPTLTEAVQSVELEHMNDFHDVSNLSTVKRLVMQHCHNVTDVSSLRNVPDLTIVDWSKELNLQSLGNHRKLEYITSNRIRNVAHLSKIPHLILVSSNSFDCDLTVLENIPTLVLESVSEPRLYPVPILRNVTSLELAYMSLIKWKAGENNASVSLVKNLKLSDCVDVHFTRFPELRELNLDYCRQIDDQTIQQLANSCRKLQKLIITDGGTITDLSPLGHLPNLTRVEFHQVKGRGFSWLSNIRTVVFNGCPGFTSGEDVRNVKYLTVKNCPELEDLSRLVEVIVLEICNCPKLKSLKGLGHVLVLRVTNCPAIEDKSRVV